MKFIAFGWPTIDNTHEGLVLHPLQLGHVHARVMHLHA